MATPLGPIRYTLERKQVKNVNLRVRKDGSVYVSASRLWSAARIDEFVKSKADFIRKAVVRVQQQPELPCTAGDGDVFYLLGKPFSICVTKSTPEKAETAGEKLLLQVKAPENEKNVQRVLGRYRDAMCRRVFEDSLNRLFPWFAGAGRQRPQLRYRDMKSRWGSCQPVKGVITMNKQLLAMPMACIDYVMLHELCHLIHPNHSQAFYALLGTLMPEWKERKKQLNEGAYRR